jgi:hypothetical protein
VARAVPVARLTYRELEDSTKKAMLHGDGSLPPLIPPELVAQYRASDNLVHLKNGAVILFRSLDEPAKLLNLTLGGCSSTRSRSSTAGTTVNGCSTSSLSRDPGGRTR